MLVIIGTGLAGYMLAKEWRKLDANTPLTLITESEGHFYSKPLLSTALTAKKSALELRINTAVEMAEQLHATIHTAATVTSIDREAKTVHFDGKTLHYDKLVLACGSSPIHLSLKGSGKEDLFSVNDLEAYGKYREWLNGSKKNLIILGSGLVGCEFTNDLVNAGYGVEILSLDSYPLAKFVPEKIGQVLQQTFMEHGVRWHLQQSAVSVDKTATGYRVISANGDEFHADGVFSAVGLLANTALAKQSGLNVARGIVVNRHLQTSDAAIYALGDCAEVQGEVKQYVAPLLQCARTLAKVLAGQNEEVHYPCMPVVIKTPFCPVVCYPVSDQLLGSWQYEGDSKHLRALFYDQEQQLRGFALVGDKVRDKMELAKQMPVVFL